MRTPARGILLRFRPKPAYNGSQEQHDGFSRDRQDLDEWRTGGLG